MIENNHVKAEADDLKTLLTLTECRDNSCWKSNLLRQSDKFADCAYTDSETWKRNTWYDSGDSETSETPSQNSQSFSMTVS